jgi:hypothetical protein
MRSQSVEYYIIYTDHKGYHRPMLAFKCSNRHELATTDGVLTISRMPLYSQPKLSGQPGTYLLNSWPRRGMPPWKQRSLLRWSRSKQFPQTSNHKTPQNQSRVSRLMKSKGCIGHHNHHSTIAGCTTAIGCYRYIRMIQCWTNKQAYTSIQSNKMRAYLSPPFAWFQKGIPCDSYCRCLCRLPLL